MPQEPPLPEPPHVPLEPLQQPEHVQLCGVWHRYPGAAAEQWTLQGIDLSLGQGELMGLLGPSGCGKTTLLRLIAGFERPAHGSVAIDGREVAGPHRWLPAERRGVGMVFQDYALFPHLDAWRNACFGLQRGLDSRGRNSRGPDTSRVAWLLDLLGLKGLEDRYPHELSGGQRQRLALARALAPGPSVVLLDEPFSNLDVEVRLRLRSELPGVLDRCGASGLMVTHDPEEALAICDRVAVLREGVLHQCASPRQLVAEPATAFVGRFLLQGNLLPAERRGDRFCTPLGWLVPARHPAPGAGPEGDSASPLQVLVSPLAIDLLPEADGPACITGREFLGREWLYQVRCGELRLRVRLPLAVEFSRGERARPVLRPSSTARLYPAGVDLQVLSASACPSPPLPAGDPR